MIVFLTCAATNPRWGDMSQPQREAGLTSIEQRCGLRTGSLKMNADSWVILNFDPNAKTGAVDCALSELKKLKVKNMGFIGNEAYPSEKN